MSEWEDESGSRVSQTTIEVRVIERLERLQSEIERLRGVLQHIAHMECYTRDGEEEPHLLMMRLAQEVLNV